MSGIRTIADMEQVTYGNQVSGLITKTDAPVLTTTTGHYNAIYGRMVWAALNREANAFALLPKIPWRMSGWRVMTTRPAHTNYGVGEGGAIPDTVKPTVAEVSTKPKHMATSFEASDLIEGLSEKRADDIWGALEELRPQMAIDHREAINEALLRDVSAEAAAGATGGGTPGNRAAGSDVTFFTQVESLDRVISSDDEEDTFGGSYDNWFDIYGKDRDTATTGFDAYVSHGSGTDRTLTDTLIRTVKYTVEQNGGNLTALLTGKDTYSRLQGLYDSYVRYSPLGFTPVQFDVNGVKTAEGIPTGINIPSLYGLPLITSKNSPSDTISRIFFLDTSDTEGFGIPRLGFQLLRPTRYYEAGMNTGHPFEVDKLSTKAMFVTTGEVICRNFAAQGKLRDLK